RGKDHPPIEDTCGPPSIWLPPARMPMTSIWLPLSCAKLPRIPVRTFRRATTSTAPGKRNIGERITRPCGQRNPNTIRMDYFASTTAWAAKTGATTDLRALHEACLRYAFEHLSHL